MNVKEQIKEYIASQPEIKRNDLQTLHNVIIRLLPKGKLWFLDGKNAEGKIVSNPNIGYGEYIIHYADGKSKAFYQIGLSANTSGISVYIMGIDNKKYLAETFGKKLGKASITGYCIKFKRLKDINTDILKEAIQYGTKKKTTLPLKSMNKEINTYNNNQTPDEQAICNLLADTIDSELTEAESKIWHAHPVWFLDGNPIVGYSKQKLGWRLMFWSGADFEENNLNVRGEKFKDASIFYTAIEQIKMKELKRWLKKSRDIQWDYKNIVKRKGKLERLK